MNVVTEVISTITEWVTGFLTMTLAVLNGMVPLFWDATETTGGLTVFGILGLMGIGIGLVYLGLNFAKGFFLK